MDGVNWEVAFGLVDAVPLLDCAVVLPVLFFGAPFFPPVPPFRFSFFVASG